MGKKSVKIAWWLYCECERIGEKEIIKESKENNKQRTGIKKTDVNWI